MKKVTAEYAGKKVKEYLEEFCGYADSPAGRVRQLGDPELREAVRLMRELEGSEGVQEAYEGNAPDWQMEALYERCTKLLSVYGIGEKVPAGMAAIKIGKDSGGALEKILGQVRKIGGGQLAERLEAVEAGEAVIVFEEMEEGREGYTSVEDGRVKYALNKKYEQAKDEEELQKAGIVLAHELQRRPGTGDLGGETAEIVAEDVENIERLAGEYGDAVYKNNPEFGVLHYVKELFGEEGLKGFAEIMFSHEGSYWQVNKDGGLDDDKTASIKDAEGKVLFNGGGRQAALAAWLGMSDAEAYYHLMQPMDYIFNAGNWGNAPGITPEVIEQARAKGVLKEEGYQKIQNARRVIQGAAVEGLLESLKRVGERDSSFGDKLRRDLLFFTLVVCRGNMLADLVANVILQQDASRSSKDKQESVASTNETAVRSVKEEISYIEVNENFKKWLETCDPKYYQVALDIKRYMEDRATMGERPTDERITQEAERALWGQGIYAMVGYAALGMAQMPSLPSSAAGQSRPAVQSARSSNLRRNNAKGKAAEKFIEKEHPEIGEKQRRYPSVSKEKKYRVADGINHDVKTISEIKNVEELSLTPQLEDYMAYADEIGYKFILYVNDGAKIMDLRLLAATEINFQ
jgi:hypothetical protein